jgi:Holliday junction resolvasome RuvABC endonuclease subunit
VDPGFGVLEAGPGGVAVAGVGVVSSAAGQPLESRLDTIHRAMRELIEAREPGLLVVEDLYAEYRFHRTAILMGHARGVISGCPAVRRRARADLSEVACDHWRAVARPSSGA